MKRAEGSDERAGDPSAEGAACGQGDAAMVHLQAAAREAAAVDRTMDEPGDGSELPAMGGRVTGSALES